MCGLVPRRVSRRSRNLRTTSTAGCDYRERLEEATHPAGASPMFS